MERRKRTGRIETSNLPASTTEWALQNTKSTEIEDNIGNSFEEQLSHEPIPKTQTISTFEFVNISNPAEAQSRTSQRVVRRAASRHARLLKAAELASSTTVLPRIRELVPKLSEASVIKTLGDTGVQRHSTYANIQQRTPKSDVVKKRNDDVFEITERMERPFWTKAFKEQNVSGSQMLLLSYFYPSATYQELLSMVRDEPWPLNLHPDYAKFTYPIEMNRDAYDVVQFLHANPNRSILCFMPIWFGLVLRDEASFYQIISTLKSYLVSQNPDPIEERKVLLYYGRALQSINRRLTDPVEGISDGLIGSVISFLTQDASSLPPYTIFYSHITGNIEKYKLDKAGLARIIQLRGGIRTVENNAEVRLMILWDDVCGACAFDISPNYSLPTAHLPPLPPSPYPQPINLTQSLTQLHTMHPSLSSPPRILSDLHTITSLIRARSPEIFNDPWFLGLHINPLIMRILNAQQPQQNPTTEPTEETKNEEIIQQILTTTSLLYLSDVRTTFIEFHITGPHLLCRLQNYLFPPLSPTTSLESTPTLSPSSPTPNTNTLLSLYSHLHLWALILGGVKTPTSDILNRKVFVDGIRAQMRAMVLWTWKDVMVEVEGFMWLGEVYGEGARRLGNDVMGVEIGIG